MTQMGYDHTGKVLATVIKYNMSDPLFEDICNFWDTTTDIYYDKIMIEFTSNTENYEKMITMVYSIIVMKMVIVCVLFMIACASFSRSWVGNVIIMLSVGLLCGSVGINILALRTSITFDNMLMIPTYVTNGYGTSLPHNENVTQSIFVDQEELFDLITTNSIEYLHFMECKRYNNIDLHQILDFSFVFLSTVCLIVLTILYTLKKYNPTEFENVYQTDFDDFNYYNQDYPKLGCFEPYSLII